MKDETFFEVGCSSVPAMPDRTAFFRLPLFTHGPGTSKRARPARFCFQIAHLLRVEWGLNKGDRVVLAFNFGLRFFAVFLGCLRAGIIAVPVYPPNPANLKKSLQKLQLIVNSCSPKMILVDPLVNKLRLTSKLLAVATGSSGWPNVTYNCPDVKEEGLNGRSSSPFAGWWGGNTSASNQKPKNFDEPSIKREDVAFLQFTSGSTSDPKGVMLTFGNLGHNIGCVVDSSNMVRQSRRSTSISRKTRCSL